MSATEYCLFFATSTPGLCWPSSEWAAWVQAIGSVFAILLAVTVPALQHRAERLRRKADARAEAVRVLTIACQMSASSLHLMVKIAEIRGDASYGEDQGERLTQHQAATDLLFSLDAFPVHTMPNHSVAAAINGIRYALRRSLLDIETDDAVTRGGSPERAAPWIETLSIVYDTTQQLISELVRLGEVTNFRDRDLMARVGRALRSNPEQFADLDEIRRRNNGAEFPAG